VRAAVYDALDPAGLAAAHQRAARLLTEGGSAPEKVAAHLLRVAPAGDDDVVAPLLEAASAAVGRGAPQGAYTYLRRALAEPPSEERRPAVLLALGRAAFLVDLRAGAEHLQEAHDQLTDPAQRADVAIPLGTAYLYLLEVDRATAAWSDALAGLAPGEHDRARRLEAALLDVVWIAPDRTDALARLPLLRQRPAHDSIGGRLLECAISSVDMAAVDPAAVPRARRALGDGSLVREVNGDGAVLCGWITLLTADDDTVMASMDSAVEQAHVNGSLYALTPAYTFRSLGWLWRGQLAAAEEDARESRRLADLTHLDINRLFADPVLVDVLLEQGRLDEAEEILRAAGVADGSATGPAHLILDSHARLLRLRGEPQAAYEAALRAADNWKAYHIANPAFTGWRCEAALALHALGRTGGARDAVAEEVELARRWGAPRALGRALRVAGDVHGGDEGVRLLQEAVAVLEDSCARLEHAKALTDLGAALRRSGQRAEARPPLRRALDLAARCGAGPLADRARTELAAAGGHPRRTALTGSASLTPAERRVAEMAAAGATNRVIAQDLYVTPKTVEVHLSSVYRKLGITTRTQLPRALSAG